MYSVSNEFKEALKSPSQQHIIDGTAGSYSFTPANIMAGSFSITNQCSDGSEITLGSVYVGELSATFMNLPVGRYEWYGMDITPYFSVEGASDRVPLGVYTVVEADWTASGTVVKAYDYMAKFDAKYDGSQVTGTAYQIAVYACNACGVELGNTEEEMTAMPNGEVIISLYDENDVETWRDLVSWLAVTLGGFATADRQGRLVFRQFTQAVADTLNASHRYAGASFSDYETRYTGLSYVDTETQYTRYFNVEPDDALVYNVGTNPFMQFGLQEVRDAIAETILAAIQSIKYVPFKVTSAGNPAYDLGDVLCFTGGLADSDKVSCITKYVFDYNKGFSMEGVGKNPTLASAKSKSDKNIAGLLSRVEANQMVAVGFVNTSAVNAGDAEETTLLSIAFATVSKNSKVDIWIEAALNAVITTSPMTVTVKYYINSNLVEYSPVETYAVEGRHILGLHYYFGNLAENTRYTFLATITAAGGSVSIDTGNIHAFLQGFGLAGEGSRWDGTIEAYDEVPVFNIGDVLNIKPFSDNILIEFTTEN